jgi:nitroimidazol reductase NimA-like FMN-containing flavoprotein (pyridoxamine 5'-phosphate oxidase superfamily)
VKEYAVDKKNKVRQLREKARYDRETVHAVLDAGLVAHVALVQDGEPVVVPMLYGRDDETLYLHGARKARIIRLLEQSGKVSINVTLLDGLVFARSTFHSSMNYRSVTVFGQARIERELKMTGVIAVDIESASAKISDKMPDDDPADLDTPVWGGILPLESRFTTLRGDDHVADGIEPSDAVRAMEGTKL